MKKDIKKFTQIVNESRVFSFKDDNSKHSISCRGLEKDQARQIIDDLKSSIENNIDSYGEYSIVLDIKII